MKTNNKTTEHSGEWVGIQFQVDDDHSPTNFSDCKVVEKNRMNGKEKEYPLEVLISLGLRLLKDKEVFSWFVNKDIDKYGQPIRKR